MWKTLRVSLGDGWKQLIIRNYEERDFADLIALQAACFPPPYPEEQWWNVDQLRQHVRLFPEGALCAEMDGIIVGSMTGMRIDEEQVGQHDWVSVTDNGYIGTHNPSGGTIYIVDICIAPLYRKYGLGKWLMQSMYETVVHLGCNRLLGGGRMPGYGAWADKLTAQQYVDSVISGELSDPVITFMLRCGRVPVGVVSDYLPDEESRNYGVLMAWHNPFITR